MATSKAQSREIAVTLSFLMQGFWDEIRKHKGNQYSIQDMENVTKLGLGEDGFVYHCYDYARLLDEAWNEIGRVKNGPGVYHYEIVEGEAGAGLAKFILAGIDLPAFTLWRDLMKSVIKKWLDE